MTIIFTPKEQEDLREALQSEVDLIHRRCFESSTYYSPTDRKRMQDKSRRYQKLIQKFK